MDHFPGLPNDKGLYSTNGARDIIIEEESRRTGTYTVVEDGYTATLSVSGKGTNFRVTDRDGGVVYDGSVDDEKQVDGLPEKARKLYEKIISSTSLLSGDTRI